MNLLLKLMIWKYYKIIVYAPTSYNRSVYAAPPVGGLASIRLGQSLRSFPRLIPAHLGGRSLHRKALLCPPKRRKQPERYVQVCGQPSNEGGCRKPKVEA
jgi:hypothetical protein